MRKMLIVVLSLAMPCAALAFQNEPWGYGGIKWGTTFEQVADEFVQVSISRDRAFYRRKGEKYTIDGAELSDVTYEFYQGVFVGVMILTKQGIQNQNALKEAVIKRFGAGEQPDRSFEHFFWSGDIAQMSLACVEAFCDLRIESKVLADRRDRVIKM